MKTLIAFASAAMIAAALSPTSAEPTRDERTLKAPAKTMGDEGKLPATEKMGDRVHDMTGPRTAATPGNEHTGASGPKGPAKRMGDEGKLPATKSMSGNVPQMNNSK